MEEVKLKDLAYIKMGQSPPSKFYNIKGEGLPFFQGVKDFGWRVPVLSVYCSNSTKVASKGDILLAVRAPVGEVNLASEKSCIGRGISSLRAKDEDNDYLYYLLKANKDHIRAYSGGTTYESINKDTLKNVKLKIHKDKTQREEIADILSTYDDLIENNNRRIEILEEMAQAIYKEWFVNFRFPGHEKTNFVDSGTEFGKIPEGWEIRKINEFVDFVRGVEPGSKNYYEEQKKSTLPFLRVGDLGDRNSGIFVKEELLNGRIINKEDLVVTMDGTVGIVKFGLKGGYSTGIRKIEIKDDKVNKVFLWQLMKSDQIQNIIRAHAKGTTILHASESINYMKFILPSKSIMDLYEKQVCPIVELMLNIYNQNNKLKQARDLLLPKLISGEIEVY
jgi:type I restriction enzyme S subunit